MSSGCAHPVDHCMCAHRVDHWMCAPSGPLDVCICITTTCKHPRAHRKRYIRWSTKCCYIWWTTSSPLVVIRMQRHLVDHRMWRSPVYNAIRTLTYARGFARHLISARGIHGEDTYHKKVVFHLSALKPVAEMVSEASRRRYDFDKN